MCPPFPALLLCSSLPRPQCILRKVAVRTAVCVCVSMVEYVCVPACRLKIDAVNQHSSIGQTARLAARQATIRSHHLFLCLCLRRHRRVTSRFLYLSIGSRLLMASILLATTAPAPAPTPPVSAAGAASPMCVTYMSICPAACSAGSALTLNEKHT